MYLHKHQLYLLEQHSETFKIIGINIEGKSSIHRLWNWAQEFLVWWFNSNIELGVPLIDQSHPVKHSSSFFIKC